MSLVVWYWFLSAPCGFANFVVLACCFVWFVDLVFQVRVQRLGLA